ncbi:ribosomal protein S6 kinase-related protein [Pogona vitticeps]
MGAAGSSRPEDARQAPEQEEEEEEEEDEEEEEEEAEKEKKKASSSSEVLKGRAPHVLPGVSWAQTWKTLLSHVGETLVGLERAFLSRNPLKPEQVVAAVAEKRPQLVEKEGVDRALPQCVSLFLPEFPVQPPRPLKIVGFVAKGSFGTVLKVLDCRQEKVFAVKVVPKVEVLRRDTLKQCKEEVSIQKQVRHPFVHGLGDTWQGQRHLFIMCPYCSSGDLYTLWKSVGRFAEAVIRLFATELVLVLAYLHNLGIVHRDVKMENILLDEQGHLKLTDFGLSRHLPWGERAYTICGTLHYMAPEVLSGGPYAHAADWWSMGVLLFALATGKFPLAPEKDHVAMLESVRRCGYAIPSTLGLGLRLLLCELLCQDPQRRLRYLHHFRGHLFFRGMTFDAEILRKQPVEFVLGLQRAQETRIDSAAFSDFDLDLTAPPSQPWPG